MKRVMFAVFALLFCFTTVAQQRSIKNLIGTWEAVRTENDGGGLQVVDSAQIFLVYGDQKKKVASYRADFSHSPARFDFVVQDSTESLNLKSLIEFINDDLIKWQLFEGDVQPVHFTSNSGEVVYLRRKK